MKHVAKRVGMRAIRWVHDLLGVGTQELIWSLTSLEIR